MIGCTYHVTGRYRTPRVPVLGMRLDPMRISPPPNYNIFSTQHLFAAKIRQRLDSRSGISGQQTVWFDNQGRGAYKEGKESYIPSYGDEKW